MHILPRFSFQYNGKPFHPAEARVIPADYGRCYELADGLRIELHIQKYPAYNAVKWMLWIENAGEHDSGLISDLLDCDASWCFTDGSGSTQPLFLYDTDGCAGYETYLHADRISEECKVHETRLAVGASRSFHPVGGRSSSGMMPFFEFHTQNRGLFAAVGWSGQWRASFAHAIGDTLEIRTGLEYTAFRLHPGERIRTSSILLMDYEGSRVQGSNLFRRLIKNEL